MGLLFCGVFMRLGQLQLQHRCPASMDMESNISRVCHLFLQGAEEDFDPGGLRQWCCAG